MTTTTTPIHSPQPTSDDGPAFVPTVDDIAQVLELAVTNQASDIILKHGCPPKVRINNVWQDVPDLPPLTISDINDLLGIILDQSTFARFEQEREYDFQFPTSNMRFRVNAAYQSGGPFLTFRPIPKEAPRLEDLDFVDPDTILPLLKGLVEQPRGLVLVTGPTGMGKSTTLAAMVRYLNENYAKNIITIEDPVEFQHNDLQSIISQREVGSDTKSFARALRGVLRQTPDVILVGELRDPETIEAALTAAETGHIVLGTLHTNNAPQAVTRILDVTSEGKVNLIRTQLAASLRAVITQQLLPRKNGKGKQVVLEVMVNTPEIEALIKKGSPNLNDYYDQMGNNTSPSVLMDMQLAIAAKTDVVGVHVAESRAIQPERFQRSLQNVSVRSTAAAPSSPSPAPTTTPASTGSGWGKKA